MFRILIILSLVLSLNGCVVGPWKMYDGAERPRGELAVLPVNGPTFRIDEVDDKRVGNVWQGQHGLSEIHVTPGHHKLLLFVEEKMDSGRNGWTLAYVYAYLRPGDGYTVKHEPKPGNKVHVWLEDKDGRVVPE